ncbi:hypothetical protein [Paraliobacillus ryukyuensis]|uniref:hypothetical protein n=1 Tax=Paraliobacillus ryukyuensis TaxID=200904 RepID=UPI0009A84B6E|nr:hypothetical protein [Paraliobacillus ryukyuensis]
MEKQVKEFLEKMTKVTQETGIILENFGDEFYDPYLVRLEEYCDFEKDQYYISWDIEKNKYVARLNDSYKDEIDIE